MPDDLALAGLFRGLGAAGNDFFRTYMALTQADAERKRQDERDRRTDERDRHDDERQDAVLAETRGIMRGTAPTNDPGRVAISGSGIDSVIRAATSGLPGFGAMQGGHPDARAPRYEQRTPGYFKDWDSDPTLRALKVADAQTAGERSRRTESYVGAGMTPGQAGAAAENPALADNFLFPSSRNIDPLSDDGIDAAERRERRLAPIRATSRSSASHESDTHRTTRQNAVAVRGQLNATLSALRAAERNTPERPTFFTSPADSTSFVQREAAADADVSRLRQRSDSLTGVLDRITGAMQGATTPAPATLRPLTARDLDKARSNPKYADFLRSRGYKLGGQP